MLLLSNLSLFSEVYFYAFTLISLLHDDVLLKYLVMCGKERQNKKNKKQIWRLNKCKTLQELNAAFCDDQEGWDGKLEREERKWKSLSRVWLFSMQWISPDQNTGVGSNSLLQGNLPNPEIEPRLPALRGDSLPTELSGKPLERAETYAYFWLIHIVVWQKPAQL